MSSLTIYALTTTSMNVWLLCLALPLGFALLVYDAWLAYRLYYMSYEDSTIAWGGLRGKVFYVWVLSFLLSSFGCTSSFVLFASLETPESSSIFLYLLMNVSYLVFNYALLRDSKTLVLVSLWTNVCVFTVLFVYTAVVFDAASHAATAGLLVATHVCNFVSIVHVYVLDLMFWYAGWIDAHAAYQTSPWSVKASSNVAVCDT
jgi:hypothetical protein